MNTYANARPISSGVLDHSIDGFGLAGSTLRKELGSGVVLLSFLRHFG